jgi:hypothetical protein
LLLFSSEPFVFSSAVYKTIILPVVLYGRENWSLILQEEHTCRLRVFENRVLRRIFGTWRQEETGGWRKLHNEDLHNLYSSKSIMRMIKSKRVEMGRACSTSGGVAECT